MSRIGIAIVITRRSPSDILQRFDLVALSNYPSARLSSAVQNVCIPTTVAIHVLHPPLQYTFVPAVYHHETNRKCGGTHAHNVLKARTNRAVRGRRISLHCIRVLGYTEHTHRAEHGSDHRFSNADVFRNYLYLLSLRTLTKCYYLANHWSNDRKENSITVDEEFGRNVWSNLKVTI